MTCKNTLCTRKRVNQLDIKVCGRMSSHSLTAAWTHVMLEAAENVRSRTRKTMLNKSAMGLVELKQLLDAEAQQAIRETLEQAGKPIQVISEEGDYAFGRGGPYMIVDPVDGTTNMAKGIPFAATSLALSKNPQHSGVLVGLVMNLYTGDVYRAERNRGAWQGAMRISTAKSKPLSKALVSIDVSKGAPLDVVEGLIQEAGHLRQLGSAALSLCHLASGLVDAHVDVRDLLRATDAAAGLLILKEAGGAYMIDGVLDGDLELSRDKTLKIVAASTPWTLDEILRTMV
jgi:myo-inositol-1(or 4)-monophosphatase